MVPARARPLITVSGACSGVGKTTLVELIVRRMAPIAALKVTVVDSGVHGCPIDRECGVCAALTVPFRILEERPRAVPVVPRKDTGRYAAAGAFPVVWVQTRGADLDQALLAGLTAASRPRGPEGGAERGGRMGVVLEGNTPVLRLVPDAAVLVDHPDRRETKASTRALQMMPERVHWIVNNRPRGTSPAALLAGQERLAAEWPGKEIVELDLRHPGLAGERFLDTLAHRCGRPR
jgi:hypothetical protein